MKKWIIRRPDEEKVENLLKKTDLPKICAQILVARGIDTVSAAADFFASGELSDPFLLKDMEKAVEAINHALDEGKLICIYGDYDCDGICATVMLYSYLESVGANVAWYIPERDDGYGMNDDAVKELAKNGVELIITVDNGISAHNEAELIYELGMELVITDHHQPSERLPKAEAIVNPHRADCQSPYKNLCGAGVVLKLIAALDGGSYDAVMEQFCDLAAIATVADVVELSGENRTIVENGLRLLSNTENLGLSALMKEAKVPVGKINSFSVAFMIAPRINAAGRFGSPSLALKLLLAEDEDEAESLASEISRLNDLRKKEEERILKEIDNIILENPMLLNERVLVFYKEGWHHGVIGIVCARLVERYGKPSFVISIEGDEARGSARNVDGYPIFEALNACSEILLKFGGHDGAGGFSLKTENIELFVSKLRQYSREKFPSMPQHSIVADKVLEPKDLSVAAIESLERLEPFGEGNSRPLFAVCGARVEEIIPLSEGKHLKLKLNYGGIIIPSLLFGTSPDRFYLNKGEIGDFLIHTELNLYNGVASVSSRTVDYRKSGMAQSKYFAAKETYEKYMLGEGVAAVLKPRIIPSREELAVVYKSLSDAPMHIDTLFMRLNSDAMNYCKLRLCLDILSELGLVHINAPYGTAQLLPVKGKANLESSKILSGLRCL